MRVLLEHQQNLSKYAIGVTLISARSNRLQDIQPAMLNVNQVLTDLRLGN